MKIIGNIPPPETVYFTLLDKFCQDHRIIVIGDVHGCLNELVLLLDKVNYKDDDIVIFVGDIVNKG